VARCIIITAYNRFAIRAAVEIKKDDYIICADGGFEIARREGILPHVIIGDMDSLFVDAGGIEVVKAPKEKDETDTFLCLTHGMKKGFKEFVIVGGIGGRLDHTLANLQLLAYGLKHGLKITLIDEYTRAFMLEKGQVEIANLQGYYLSLLAFSETCTGVSASGVKYPLKNATLKNDFALGVSNEIIEDAATIENETGLLLILLCKE
jgi:thiamine pyrophosphokinase